MVSESETGAVLVIERVEYPGNGGRHLLRSGINGKRGRLSHHGDKHIDRVHRDKALARNSL